MYRVVLHKVAKFRVKCCTVTERKAAAGPDYLAEQRTFVGHPVVIPKNSCMFEFSLLITIH